MPTIPKLSTPLAKLIRTGEGVLLYLFNLAMLVGPIISSALPATTAVKYAAIFNAVAFASRTLLKAMVAAKPTPPPFPPLISTISGSGFVAPVSTPVAPSPDAVLADIAAQEQAATAIQAQPGTPADQITAALSPSPGAVSPPAA